MSTELPTRGLASASEMTRQVITLSTGVTALTITFFEKFGADGQPLPTVLYVAWACFAFSIFCGLWTLAAITGSYDALDRRQVGGHLTPAQAGAADKLAMAPNIRIPGVLMCLSFVLGLVFAILSVP